MMDLENSAGFEQAFAQLARSLSLSRGLGRVALATPEEPVLFEQFAPAGQPFLTASIISAWREQGQVDTTIWLL